MVHSLNAGQSKNNADTEFDIDTELILKVLELHVDRTNNSL